MYPPPACFSGGAPDETKCGFQKRERSSTETELKLTEARGIEVTESARACRYFVSA